LPVPIFFYFSIFDQPKNETEGCQKTLLIL
jgi:hypothetical protein